MEYLKSLGDLTTKSDLPDSLKGEGPDGFVIKLTHNGYLALRLILELFELFLYAERKVVDGEFSVRNIFYSIKWKRLCFKGIKMVNWNAKGYVSTLQSECEILKSTFRYIITEGGVPKIHYPMYLSEMLNYVDKMKNGGEDVIEHIFAKNRSVIYNNLFALGSADRFSLIVGGLTVIESCLSSLQPKERDTFRKKCQLHKQTDWVQRLSNYPLANMVLCHKSEEFQTDSKGGQTSGVECKHQYITYCGFSMLRYCRNFLVHAHHYMKISKENADILLYMLLGKQLHQFIIKLVLEFRPEAPALMKEVDETLGWEKLSIPKLHSGS